MEYVTWDLMETFRNQQKEKQERVEARRKAVNEAQEKLNAAMYKEQEFQIRQFQGERVEEERKQAQTELEKARADYDNAMKEWQRPVDSENDITPETLARDWNENICPKIKENHVKPIANQMKKARYVYLKALYDYYTILDAYNNDANEASNLAMIHAMQKGETSVDMQPLHDMNELPLLRQDHLNAVLYQREIPEEVRKGLKIKQG